MWRLHYTSPLGHRLTLRGSKRKTLLATLNNIAPFRSRVWVYQKSGSAGWYRSSLVRLLSY